MIHTVLVVKVILVIDMPQSAKMVVLASVTTVMRRHNVRALTNTPGRFVKYPQDKEVRNSVKYLIKPFKLYRNY